MKIQLRRLETNETLNFEFSDASTLHDLRLLINKSTPSSVHFSLNRNDELLAPSSQATLRSLGLNSGSLIDYSLDSSNFCAMDQEFGSSSSAEAQKTQASVAEASAGKLTENATLGQESETNQSIVCDYMSIESVESGSVSKSQNQASTDTNSGAEEPESKDVNLGGMNLAGRERLSEPLFLEKILLEESADTCEFTVVIMTIHAVMLESGFVLFNPDSGMRFSFMEQMHSISLKYTLPALISANEPSGIESVGLMFQRLGHMVVAYGSLGVSSFVRRVCFDKRKYVHIVDLLMGTLKSEKEDTLSIHRKVFMCWRVIKDGFVTPLLIDLCYKAGLELPPCFMRLPPELKRKILESLHGVNIAKLACVSSELRDLASDNDLWKQKCVKEFQNLVTEGIDVVNWKERFATYWKQMYMASRRFRLYHASPFFRGIIRR